MRDGTAFGERWVRAQGFAFDAMLIAVAAAVSEDVIEAWLLDDPQLLYYGLMVVHLVTYPALFWAVIAGYGRAGRVEELQRRRAGPLHLALTLFFGGSFVIPGVLGLTLDVRLWVMMTTVFGPLLALVLWVGGMLWAERRGLVRSLAVGQSPPWLHVQALALLTWAYLIWLETMLIVAAAKGGSLADIGIPLGVLIDYIPVRVLLYYVRAHTSRWEVSSIAAGGLHLLWRISSAGG